MSLFDLAAIFEVLSRVIGIGSPGRIDKDEDCMEPELEVPTRDRKEQGIRVSLVEKYVDQSSGTFTSLSLDTMSKIHAELFLEAYPEWEEYFSAEPHPEDSLLEGEYYLLIRAPSPAPSTDRELIIEGWDEISIYFDLWHTHILGSVGDSDEDYFNRAKQVIDSIINEDLIFEVSRWGNVSEIKPKDVLKIMPGAISHTYSWRGTYDKPY